MFSNLIPVTLGNIFGGSVMVAGIYYVIFIHGLKAFDS
jgi:formate/nitrite transporter FocA (FNT family)